MNYSTNNRTYKRINGTPHLLFIYHEKDIFERVEIRKFLWFKWYKGFGRFREPNHNFYLFN